MLGIFTKNPGSQFQSQYTKQEPNCEGILGKTEQLQTTEHLKGLMSLHDDLGLQEFNGHLKSVICEFLIFFIGENGTS